MDPNNHPLNEIRTTRLILTRMTKDYLDDLIRMYSDSQVMATLGGVRSPSQTAPYLDQQVAHWDRHGFGFWAALMPAQDNSSAAAVCGAASSMAGTKSKSATAC